MRNTPGHPDQESPRASSESLLFNKDSEGKLLPGRVAKGMFDASGKLILPGGTQEVFAQYRKEFPRRKTSIFAECPRCGHRWERMTKKGTARCFLCKKRFSLEDLK